MCPSPTDPSVSPASDGLLGLGGVADKGLTLSMPIMMNLGSRKEDAGESKDRSAKLRQPTNITRNGEPPRLQYV
jgi:hypothetical protein